LENQKIWEFLHLEQSGYQSILIDLPGHGLSESEFVLHSMEYMADEIIKVLDKEEINEAFFIGHSMGGYVILALIEKYPEKVKGLSMFFSSTFADSEDKKVQRLRAVDSAHNNLDAFINIGCT
jgi:pimeloyl-ACP methyl ester carboxylesterase